MPREEGKVTFYACGPTAYEVSNLSLCRRFIVSDLITRTLEAKGFQVDAYMNFTDIDDNTIFRTNVSTACEQFCAGLMSLPAS